MITSVSVKVLILSLFYQAAALLNIDEADWNALNETVKGRLHVAYPVAKPCYSQYNGQFVEPNDEQCEAVKANYTSSAFQSSNFGGYGWTNYGSCMSRSESCTLIYGNAAASVPTTENCQQGSVADYYIAVQEPSDVQAALDFGRRTKTRLAVKNSGHDHKGRGAVPGSLGIWMHTLQPPLQLIRDFVPEGCSDVAWEGRDAVTMGGGQEFWSLYRFAAGNNITVVGGSSSTVRPAGGWTNGGGHSTITNKFGLGVDNVLQFKTVLPDGRYVTANRCQNSDIFVALRGGGGNAFGVNMEMTIKARPQQVTQSMFFYVTARNPATFKTILRNITANSNAWAKAGWGGVMGTGIPLPLSMSVTLANLDLNSTAARDSMASFLPLASDTSLVAPGGSSGINTYQSYHRSFTNPEAERLGVGVAMSTRLIPRSALDTPEGVDKMTDALATIAQMITPQQLGAEQNAIVLPRGIPVEMLMTTPFNYKPSTDPNDGTSVTPTWRNATWHVVLKDGFQNDATAEQVVAKYKNAHAAIDILRKLVPDTGAYQNEADVYEVNGIETFWGRENYERLLKLKREIDPDNLMTCWGCVGWNPKDERFACYPDIGVTEQVEAGYKL